ncbi:RNA-binding (RRM/RBD/RNP motifs) family protein [Striga hermonthica]|uniref:RNA-binding (RRM/RBD/RNP motifs) family protein n=1 Tax=Striga hermonthica TaxID=68872 RepID=A0A9N7N3W7_STRHE|nr:RNA-binding (RRM/RBD/RNP motifs) family protein [Striga hermonthica]
MASTANLPYRKLKYETWLDQKRENRYYNSFLEKVIRRSRSSRLGKLRTRRKQRLKIPSLRRFLRRKARVLKFAWKKVCKRPRHSGFFSRLSPASITVPSLSIAPLRLSPASVAGLPPSLSRFGRRPSAVPVPSPYLDPLRVWLASIATFKEMAEEELAVARDSNDGSGFNEEAQENEKMKQKMKDKKKKRLLKEAERAEKRGVCYLSRVPPHMDPLKLRQILSQYGEIQRLYLAPEDAAAQVRRKKSGGFRGQEFSEGHALWVEFSDKKVAKRVARMLNGEQIGGKKRSSFYYDLWNIKYLSKFKWDDLTAEIAYKTAIREQKLAMELSAAKRERDFYLSKVDQSKALSKIEERLKKKQKIEVTPKVVRQFPQKKPVAKAEENKGQLSRDVLSGVFGGSS